MLFMIIAGVLIILSIVAGCVGYYIVGKDDDDYFSFSDPSTAWIVPGIIIGISAIILCILGGIALHRNTYVEARHYEVLQERNTLCVQLKYYENYGTDIIKSERAVSEYTWTLYSVKEFNSAVYRCNLYKDDLWIGLYQDKAYLNVEPIEYTNLLLGD